MKTKYYFLAALATAVFASCTSDEYVGDATLTAQANGPGAINFSYNLQAPTRADQDHATSAATLGNQFIVWGEKNETTAAPAAGNLVFQNYLVQYGANTAYTTTSNTEDWEYVGVTPFNGYSSYVAPNNGTGAQTIKYWDYSATNYTFTAVSAKQTDISGGNVKITKNQSGTTVYDKGYKLTLAKEADLSKIFIADRQPITASAGTDRHADNTYGGNVTFKFRNILSHIRVGMFETISGYKVTLKKFYYVNDAAPTFLTMTTAATDKFTANVPNVGRNNDATLTIKYGDNASNPDEVTNRPIVSVSTTPANYIQLGTGLKADVDLATSVVAPTYDNGAGVYTPFYPQEANAKSLKLKVDYTLTSTDNSGETIEVTGATAEIPAEYLQWKPNYKYTYLFKISENTNGSTGGGVVGLYPITFDAVVAVAEDGLAEFITTVSEPSITTFGVKGGVYFNGNKDYEASTAVYAVVEDGSSLATLSSSNMKLYTVTTSDATNFPITEASVAEALIEGPTLNNAQATAAKIKFPSTPDLTYQKTVPAEDGSTTTLDADNNKAATFTTAASTVYALVYQKTAATYTVDGGNTYADEAAFNAAGTLYTNAECTAVATWGNSSTTYYKRTAVNDKGAYVVKIVKAEKSPSPLPPHPGIARE